LLQTTLTFEKRDKEHREQVNQSKLRFFTNISHELRTPLTLIVGQLELLLHKKGKQSHDILNEIHRSATEMNELINELMDFQKHDQGMFKIHVKEQNIVEFVRDIYASFNGYAELKEIDFTFNTKEDEILVWFDPTQLQKVFNNLLANAFKYTAKRGKIQLNISRKDNKVSVSIVDNGIGISAEYKQQIFDRFYQVDNAVNNEIYHTGTGIGLSLSQSIIKAHVGTINVISEENKGSEFIVELFLGEKHFEGKELVEIVRLKNQAIAHNEIDNYGKDFQIEIMELQQINLTIQPTILIVEDDDNLRKMLIQIFDPIALTLEASNGIEGLTIAKDKLPDLILSDIIMPGMSGYELCRKMKTDFETCHIPVILLTALSTLDQTIEGVNCGADDYIVKPFNVKLLITKCLGLLNNRRILQEKFSKEIDETPVTITTNPLDRAFVEKIIHIIETNLENGEINISLLCSEMAVSRTILFSKMKGITGQTPHDFIQNIKLKLAAKMIQEQPDKNITEIADFLGFSSLNYFGKTFKEHFGFSPTSLRKKGQEDDLE
jgi:DNA-binding response OmpR family regulator